MSFNRECQRQFERKILQDQRQHQMEEFQQTAQQWLEAACKWMQNESNRSLSAKKDLSHQKHPNQIMADLKRLNYERAYVDLKIQAMDKNQKMPGPKALKRQLREAELEIKFQKDFPAEFQQFQHKLQQQLRKKPFKTKPKLIKLKNHDPLGLDLNISLENHGHENIQKCSKSREPKTNISTNVIIRSLQRHGIRHLQHKSGYYHYPNFTKEKVQTILGTAVSNSKFQKVISYF